MAPKKCTFPIHNSNGTVKKSLTIQNNKTKKRLKEAECMWIASLETFNCAKTHFTINTKSYSNTLLDTGYAD